MKKLSFVLTLLLLCASLSSYSQAGEVRTWTAGSHSVEGEFVELTENGTIVRIRKTNGVVTRVQLTKLSQEDQEYVKEAVDDPFEDEKPEMPIEARETSNVSGSKIKPLKPSQTSTDEEIFFAPVLLYLQQRNLDAAKRELQRFIGAAPGSKAAQIEMAANCFIAFYESVLFDLKRVVPPQELCKGEYCVIESNPPNKIIIRAAGRSLRFSLDDPESHGENLFEIFYRHRKMKVEGTRDMQPDLGYAAYILFTESADHAPAVKLLNDVQANGSLHDRETAQALKNLFKLP